MLGVDIILESKICCDHVSLFSIIAVKRITRMPPIKSDSVIANQEDTNEKGNYHVFLLEGCISVLILS